MASWNDIADYLRGNFKIHEDKGDLLVLLFTLSDDRSQFVGISLSSSSRSGEEWVEISSPVGSLGEVDLGKAATIVARYFCGGLVAEGDLVYVRHVAPLINLDVNELERPMSVILDAADHVERELVGGDRF